MSKKRRPSGDGGGETFAFRAPDHIAAAIHTRSQQDGVTIGYAICLLLEERIAAETAA